MQGLRRGAGFMRPSPPPRNHNRVTITIGAAPGQMSRRQQANANARFCWNRRGMNNVGGDRS